MSPVIDRIGEERFGGGEPSAFAMLYVFNRGGKDRFCFSCNNQSDPAAKQGLPSPGGGAVEET